MKTKFFLNLFLFLNLITLCSIVNAQETILKLYDGPAPGSEKWTHKEYRYEYQSPFWHEKNVALFNVVEPTLTVFLPEAKKATGSAIVVCPGGGYSALSWDTEGINVGKKLADMGIAAFVLKYRIAYSGGTPEEVNLNARTSYGGEKRTPESTELSKKNAEMTKSMTEGYVQKDTGTATAMNNPLTTSLGNIGKMSGDDGRRAIEYIRNNAAEWNIKSDKIGMIGFSAGGMLALDVAFNHTEQSKPNVIGLIYGVFGAHGIPADPMPLFMAATQYEATGNAAALYGAWCNAKQPSEIHSFTDSRHGFGYRNNGDPVNSWIDLFYNFLKKIKFIE
jgi:hypothetical protein